MTIYYVSNSATNGYVVGNDANSGLTPGTAKLTLNSGAGTGAIPTASAGDTIYINPSATPYSENTPVGLNYLQINKANLIIETDPAYVSSVGKATITSPAAGTRTINMNEAGITLRNIRVDNASQTRNCIFCQSFSSQICIGIDFLNLGANAIAITAQNNNAYNITIEKCTLLSANGNAAGTKLHQITGTLGGMATSIKGCSVDTTGGLFSAGAGFGGTVTIDQTSDGVRNTVSNATLGIQNLSTNIATTFSIKNTDFIACTTGIGDGGTTSATLADLDVLYCKFSGLNGSLTATDILFVSTISDGEIAYCSFEGSHRNLSMSSGAIQGIIVHDNYVNTTAMGTGIGNFFITRGGAGIEFYNNTITSNTEVRVINIGGDGYASAVTNTGGAAAGDRNFGDVAGNTWVAQTFTYPAAATALFTNYVGAFDVTLKKVGSPTGTVTAFIYTNSAGAPDNLVATSSFTLTSSMLTGSYQNVRFWFRSRTQLSYSTQYWIVLRYNGTINGSDYLQLQGYNAGTAIQVSTNGIAWGAGAGAAVFNVRQINLSIVNPKIYNNYVNATNASNIQHCLMLNGTDGGLVYENQIYGGAIGILFKLCDGSVQDLIAYNNLISFTNSGDGAALHDKGSNDAQWYNNTVAIYTGDNKALFLEGDWNTGFLNGTPTDSPIVRNTLIASLTSAGGSIIQYGNDDALDFTCISPDTDYNVFNDISAKLFAKVNLGQAATLTNYATLAAFQGATGTDANSLDTNPNLYNDDILSPPTTPKGFTLNPDSSAIGTGETLALPTDDYFGVTRLVPNSIGAIDFIRRTGSGSRDLVYDREVV